MSKSGFDLFLSSLNNAFSSNSDVTQKLICGNEDDLFKNIMINIKDFDFIIEDDLYDEDSISFVEKDDSKFDKLKRKLLNFLIGDKDD